jgi:predicted phosphate transport protein (TIGR00153 family)
MLSWFHALLPREERFFDMFDRHAALLVQTAQIMPEMLAPGANIQDCCERISKLEDDADAITREVLMAVRRTFVTPFDRSDIQALISSMDDSIDQMKKFTKAVQLYEVTTFEPSMRRMADMVVKAAGPTAEIVEALRHMRKKAAHISVLAEEVIRIEDEADVLHDQGIKALYHAHRHNGAMDYIVGTKLYDALERIMDRLEDVAKNTNSIVIENV